MKTGVEVLIDWLTFTVKTADDPEAVIRDFLGMDPDLFQDYDYSPLPGYSCQKLFSDIHVSYSGRNQINRTTGAVVFDGRQMGVCVSMSGNGCRTFEKFSTLRLPDKNAQKNNQGTESYAFTTLFHLISAFADVNITRIDIACDDHSGFLQKEDMLERYQRGGFRTRATQLTWRDGRAGRLKEDGFTFYVGARSSDCRIKFYDKAAEQKEECHWIRCELTLKHEHSREFVCQLVKAGAAIGDLVAQVLNDKFAFIDLDDSNISRCSVCVWWLDFVGLLKSVHLVSREVVSHPVEHIRDWMAAQIACSLAIISETMGYFALRDMIQHGKERLSKKQKALIRDYNALRYAPRPGPFCPAPPLPALSV